MQEVRFDNPWEEEQQPNSKKPSESNTIYDKVFKKLTSGNKNEPPKLNLSKIASLVLIAATAAVVSTGFYTVQMDEQAVVTRFGRYARTTGPGLNYKLPDPIEKVEKISVTRLNRELIGAKVDDRGLARQQPDEDTGITNESQMLTGDENIIEMHFFVQWRIKDPMSYLFNIKDRPGESSVRTVAESVIRQVIGVTRLYEALSEQRQMIENKVESMLQTTLDSYGAGVEVTNVGILYSYVAPEVRDAYRDVQAAKADRESEINKAQAYSNEIIPRARGEGQAVLEAAKAYRDTTVALAQGDVARYISIYNQYKNAKSITKKRIYIETMEVILKEMQKVIVDKEVAKGAMPIIGTLPNSFPLKPADSDTNHNDTSKR